MNDPSAVGQGNVLMVDDESNVLDGYRRALRGRFQLVTAGSGAEGLLALEQASVQGQPFSVIVSDMMMPAMNGAQFLGRAHEIEPEAVQLLLSGQADLDSTIAAVNNGNLFRFLTKPCPAADLERALTAAQEQYRLVRAERELLERTLAGAVAVLTELLSMASPEGFARTERVRNVVEFAAQSLGVEDWRLPLATMLSQIGSVAVPADVLHRAQTGAELDDEETEVYLGHPRTAQLLLQRIPRLEDVACWVGDQPIRPPGTPPGDTSWQAAGPDADRNVDRAELVFRGGLAFLGALDATGEPARAARQLTAGGHYPPEIVGALEAAAAGLTPGGIRRELAVQQVRPGMLLEEDVETVTGMTLVRKGERLTEAAVMRLQNFARTVGVKEPVAVLDGL
jgi:CheY-like chemotaxis protein